MRSGATGAPGPARREQSQSMRTLYAVGKSIAPKDGEPYLIAR